MVKVTLGLVSTLLRELTQNFQALTLAFQRPTLNVEAPSSSYPHTIIPTMLCTPSLLSLQPPNPPTELLSPPLHTHTPGRAQPQRPAFILILASTELSPNTSSVVFPSRDFLSDADVLGAHCSPLSLPDITSPPSYITTGL